MRGRKDPEALRAVAREMESLFAYEMVKAMRATAGGAASGKGFGGDVYGSLFDMELARVISSRGLGLQEILLRGIGRGKSSGTEVKGSRARGDDGRPRPRENVRDSAQPATGDRRERFPPSGGGGDMSRPHRLHLGPARTLPPLRRWRMSRPYRPHRYPASPSGMGGG